MNGFNIDEERLLTQLRQAKDIQIERLLRQYGTSLADVREMYPQLTKAISQRQLTTTLQTQPFFFTAAETAQMGLGIGEGWMLKMSPTGGKNGDRYAASLITPEQWEITEDDLYISPVGEQYTRLQLEALLGVEQVAPPEGLEPGEEITLTEGGQRLYEEYQFGGGKLTIPEWLRWMETQRLETEQVFGKVFPEQDIQEVMDYISANPEQFLADIREIGPTEDMVALLKTLEFEDEEGNIRHLTDSEIQELFGAPVVMRLFTEAVMDIAPPTQPWATMTTALYRRPEDYTVKDYFRVLGQSLLKLPRQIAASILQATQGQLTTEHTGASVVNKDWADEYIEEAAEDLDKFVQDITEAHIYAPTLIREAAFVSRNLAYSITSMGAGLIVGVPTAFIPLPGARVAAWTLGTAASGAVAYQMTTYQIMQMYLEFKNEEQIQQTGTGLTLEEENQLKADFSDKAHKYGLWEAIPEAISNLLFGQILMGPLGRMIGGPMAAKIITKIAMMYGEELLTETITQKGQSALEVEAGLREERIGWVEAFKEIAPQTFLLTTIMAGAGQVVISSSQAIKKVTTSLKNEIGEGHPLHGEIKQGIETEMLTLPTEAVIPEVTPITPEVTKPTPITPEIATGQPYTATVYRGYKVEGVPVDVGLFGKGTYYTTNREYAETYDGKEVLTVTLKNPFVINTQQEYDAFQDETTRSARQKALNEGKTVEEADELAARAAREWLESRGYDGLIARNIIAPGDEVVVFHPEKTVGPKVPTAEAVTPEVTQAIGNLKVGAWLQLKPEGRMYEVTEIGKRRTTIRDSEGNISTFQNAQQVYPLEAPTPKVTPEVTEETVEAKTRRQLEGLGKMYQEWWSKRRTAEQTKVALARYVRENLPMDVRGKFLTAVAKVKTDAQLQVQMDKVNEFAEQNAQKVLKVEIRQELKKARAKIREHILKGKFTPEVQRRLDVLTNNLEADRDVAREKIAENIIAYEEGKLGYEEMLISNETLNFAGIEGMSAMELVNVLEYTKSLEAFGRSERQAKQEAATEIITAIRSDISGILTGGKGLKTGIGAIPTGELVAKTGWWDKFTNWQYGIDNLADKLSKLDPTSKPYQSALSEFVAQVHRATIKQVVGTKNAFIKVKDIIKRVYEVKTNREINQILNALDEETNLGVFELTEEYKANHPGATTITLKMTRNQMIAKYMQMQDSTLSDTFTTGMGWSQEVRNAIENNLTVQEKQLANEIFSFYEDYYTATNEIYQELFNVDMPHNPAYSPIRRDFEADIIENVLTLRDASQFASVLNGSLKARQRNIRPLRFNGALDILSNHIQQMEHFKAWATTMRDMRRVFGNKATRQAIEQYHGQGVLRLIDTFLNQMARGGIETASTNHAADFLRINFSKSILAIKPVILMKQIPSLFGYISEMSVPEFFGGIADFWTSPITNFKFLYSNSGMFRARIEQGFERDIRAAMQKHGKKLISGQGKFTDWFLLQIRLGDTFAVTQGMWAKYKAGLKQGLTQEKAIAAAEDTTGRTQPSFGIDTLSAIQNGGSFLKLLTMFQNQPNKYFRMVGDNLRNFKYGRGSRAKAASTILLAWVILPMMFQFIADAFQWKPERQARAGILGPLNFVLIGGQLVQSMWGWLTDMPFDYQISPVAQTGRDLQMIFLKAKKLIAQGQDPYKDIQGEDVAALIEYLAKAIGQVTGLPTPYFVQLERLLRHKFEEGEEIRIKDFLFSEWALKPPAKNAEEKVEDASLLLGEVKEGQEDTPLSERELKFYTTVDWFRDIGDIYSKVLPQDVLEDSKASKESKLWAQYELARSKADILPNISLHRINTEDNNDTIIHYYQQWNARQRITSLVGLKEFDKLYPKAYLGNVTRQQYDLLKRYLEAEDKDAFLESHPELRINPRDEWLKENPVDNAMLAIGGQAKILTHEAYNELKKLIKEFDIPDNAIPDFTLPPEGSVENYFKYLETGEELGWNSWEIKLLLSEDDQLRQFLAREPIDENIEALRLQVKHRDLTEEYEGYGDRDSPYYIEDKEARADSREAFGTAHPEWVEDRYRIDAYQMGLDKFESPSGETLDLVEDYVTYYSYPEAGYRQERYLLENKWKFGEDDFYGVAITPKDQGGMGLVPFDSDYRVPDVRYDEIYEQYQDLFEAYEDVTGTTSEREAKREQILKSNPDFARARRERDAYKAFVAWGDINIKDVSPADIDGIIQHMERMRLRYTGDSNEDLIWKGTYTSIIGQLEAIKLGHINLDQIDIEIARLEEAIRLETKYGRIVIGLEKAVDFLRQVQVLKKQAVGSLDDLVKNYVDWYSTERSGYEDDWWLMEHPDFERAMLQLYKDTDGKDGWKEARDFSKVPTRAVWNLYQTYQGLPSGTPRLDYRARYPELDAWLVSAKDYTPVKDRGSAEAPPTPWEELAQVKRFTELFK